MEQLLHYVWKHKMFPLKTLTTMSGAVVDVIDSGLHNQNAGPDFFNAKVKIGGMLWVGNVEIHDKASDWYAHGHDKDERYDNVILHVCGVVDAEAVTSQGNKIEQMQLDVPAEVTENYQQLLQADRYPPCYKVIPQLPKLISHSWMSALLTERLERKTLDIARRLDVSKGSWEEAYFVTLARYFGFGINGDAFEQWAESVPMHDVDHHRDNLFQIESLFMGQAGLLNVEAMPERHREEAAKDDYFNRMKAEYAYLSHKFSLQPIDSKLWRFLRLRPQNFPHIRLSQLANLYFSSHAGFADILDCKTVDDVKRAFDTCATEYWQTHYLFGQPSKKNEKHLSASSINLLIINVVVPVLFAYGRHRDDEALCERSFDLLEGLKAENNNIVRMWQECGLEVNSAGDSQALINLKTVYCDRKDCLRCRFGYEYIKRTKQF